MFAVQVLLDKSTPHTLYRWLALAAVLLMYAVRVYLLQGCVCCSSSALMPVVPQTTGPSQPASEAVLGLNRCRLQQQDC